MLSPKVFFLLHYVGADTHFIPDIEAEPKDDAAPVVENVALSTALKAFSSLTREQKAALSKTLEGFVACLAPSDTDVHANPHARTVITEAAWENRANWGRDEWNAWETWGWYRQFCRAVSCSFSYASHIMICAHFLIFGWTVLPVFARVLNHTIHSVVCQVRTQEGRCSGFTEDGVEYRYRPGGLIFLRRMRCAALLQAYRGPADYVYLLIVYTGCPEIILVDASVPSAAGVRTLEFVTILRSLNKLLLTRLANYTGSRVRGAHT